MILSFLSQAHNIPLIVSAQQSSTLIGPDSQKALQRDFLRYLPASPRRSHSMTLTLWCTPFHLQLFPVRKYPHSSIESWRVISTLSDDLNFWAIVTVEIQEFIIFLSKRCTLFMPVARTPICWIISNTLAAYSRTAVGHGWIHCVIDWFRTSIVSTHAGWWRFGSPNGLCSVLFNGFKTWILSSGWRNEETSWVMNAFAAFWVWLRQLGNFSLRVISPAYSLSTNSRYIGMWYVPWQLILLTLLCLFEGTPIKEQGFFLKIRGRSKSLNLAAGWE